MKSGIEREIIEKQFIKAIDYLKIQIQNEYKEGVQIDDTYFGKMLYPSNRYFIQKVRENTKNLPHMAMIALARMYNIDFNFFYDKQAEPEAMFLTKDKNKHVSKEVKQKQKVQLAQAIEDLESKIRHGSAVLEGCKDDDKKDALKSIEPLVSACHELLEQNKERLSQKSIRLIIDQAVHLIRTKFELFALYLDHKDQTNQLTLLNDTLKQKILQLENELTDCFKDVKEYSKVALEAQRAEAAALRQLLAK